MSESNVIYELVADIAIYSCKVLLKTGVYLKSM